MAMAIITVMLQANRASTKAFAAGMRTDCKDLSAHSQQSSAQEGEMRKAMCVAIAVEISLILVIDVLT